ncbi:MAG: hypothetical protein V2J25_17160 [Desulfatiglans sp.]|jgi:hypothetical protein|nr:hypothetical protein [Thermodesulfobacteriota bacterium]MEE4354589.1 hypothetical protein [Desulfatiglans sp.]
MDDSHMLDHLEALAHQLGIEVRYENLESEIVFGSRGGLCRVRDKQVVIISTTVDVGEKTRTLGRALKRFDLSRHYIRPALRDFLERV